MPPTLLCWQVSVVVCRARVVGASYSLVLAGVCCCMPRSCYGCLLLSCVGRCLLLYAPLVLWVPPTLLCWQVSGSSDCGVRVWRRYPPGNLQGVATVDGEAAWKCVCVLSGHHNGPVYDVKWCPLNNAITTACGDDTIRIFREETGSDPDAPVFHLVTSLRDAHSEDVNSVDWHPVTPGLLASAGDDGLVKLWDCSAVF